MNKWEIDDDKLDFLDESVDINIQKNVGVHKVLIADDEEEVHRITKVILNDFMFQNMGLEFYDTYSGAETKKILKEHDDIAVLFLDVVMESKNSGLEVVEYLRNELKNPFTRIVLRTGQPGEAPEETIIRDYDINDYRLKTELTVKRLMTTMYASIRNYLDLKKLEKHQEGLKKIIKASAVMFEHNSLDEFLTSILEELSSFNQVQSNVLYIRNDEKAISSGFVTIDDQNKSKIVAATGKYKHMIGMVIGDILELQSISAYINSDNTIHEGNLQKIENGFLIASKNSTELKNYIFIEGDINSFDFDLINIFLSNFAIALDNFVLNNMLHESQKEMVYALAETIDCHYEVTGQHIKRISNMMYQFALSRLASFQEAEMYRLASTMHDMGKVAIPDAILKKPGKLTEEEYEIMKSHTYYGHKILSTSDSPILKLSAEIALNHHERFDGTGYPNQLCGREIPMSARMMAIVDFYDALTHERIYKNAYSREDTISLLEESRGTHFDSDLLDVFLKDIDIITKEI